MCSHTQVTCDVTWLITKVTTDSDQAINSLWGLDISAAVLHKLLLGDGPIVAIIITCFGTVWPLWCWCAVQLWYHHHRSKAAGVTLKCPSACSSAAFARLSFSTSALFQSKKHPERCWTNTVEWVGVGGEAPKRAMKWNTSKTRLHFQGWKCW